MLERFGELLRAAGYTSSELAARLDMVLGEPFAPVSAPVHSRRLGEDALATLARVLLLGYSTPRDRAAEVLAPLGIDELIAAGVLRLDGADVWGAVRITPYEDLLLVSDPDAQPWAEDHVLAPGPTARALDHFTPRTPVGRALDIGTGSGVQALRIARHADHVVATDTNARALDLTRMSAQLSGLANVECRHGSLFEPVAGEEFDLVVCNPPFVISPRSDYSYRDGGFPGDGLTEAVVSAMPAHIRDGGTGVVLGNWFVAPDAATPDRPLGWLERAGCDVVVVHYDSEDILEYAARWNEELAADGTAYGAAIDDWVAYLAGFGAEAIATGAVTMRRRAGASNTRSFQMAVRPGPTAGAQVARIVATLTDAPVDAIAGASVLKVPDGVLLDQRLGAQNGEFVVGTAQFTLPQAAGIAVEAQPAALHVLLALDGERSLADLAAEVAVETDLDAAEIESLAVRAAADLYAAGMVVRAERA
ncbi:MAG TPA: class I SAM-dependent methyltransferase [Acidimicrobiales bacterium]|nr:class I SAM-dependent methyltransferase [Acidimicrobiales bacterium]